MTLDESLFRLRGLYEDWDAAVRRELISLPKDFACPESCSRCCEATPWLPVTASEAHLVLESLRALGSAELERVRERVNGKTNGACPLLEGGRCLVYSARPLYCRAYGFSAQTPRIYFGCEILAERLRSLADFNLPLLDAAHPLLPSLEFTGRDGRILPALAPLPELLALLID